MFAWSSERLSVAAMPIGNHAHARRRSSISLFTKVPQHESWIMHGLVEKQTMSSEKQWDCRRMILTSSEIVFSMPDSDVIMDKISLEHVSFIGKMSQEQDSSLENPRRKKIASLKFTRSTSKIGSLSDVSEVFSESFAFEIKAALEDSTRSYFVRIDTEEDCNEWIAEINHALDALRSKRPEEKRWVSWSQERARRVYGSTFVRCTIAAAIITDFILSILVAEFMLHPDTPSLNSLQTIVRVLDVFFALELMFNAFANWKTSWGDPFVRGPWNWYHAGTVIFQLVSFLFFPSIEVFKVVRIMRIFHIVTMFKQLVALNIILKALRQGERICPLVDTRRS